MSSDKDRKTHFTRLAVAALLLAGGCKGDSTGPFATLTSNTDPDNFSFVGQTYDRTATTTFHYSWIHSGTVALVVQGPSADLAATPLTGTATVTIHDAAGVQVYTHDLTEALSDTTALGTAGTWTIDLAFTNAKGDALLSVKKGTRDLTVAPNTTGTNRDPDGYTLTLDGTVMQVVATDATFTFNNVSAGTHTVVLSGIAANCTPTDGTSRTLTVPAGIPTTATFAIACS